MELYGKRSGRFPKGPYHKWASYGFTAQGVLRLEEYYPNAVEETYKGIPGYIYTVESDKNIKKQQDIPDAFISEYPMIPVSCEYIPDAYEAILAAAREGKITIQRYGEIPDSKRQWIESAVRQQLKETNRAEYQAFLIAKFSFLQE